MQRVMSPWCIWMQMPCRSDPVTIHLSVLACIKGHCQHYCWFVLHAKMPQPVWTAPDLIGMVDVQAALRDKLLQDHSVLAAFLTGLRMYLEDPTKVMQPNACHPMQAWEQISNKEPFWTGAVMYTGLDS